MSYCGSSHIYIQLMARWWIIHLVIFCPAILIFMSFGRERRNADLLKDKTLVTAFYQPSTRTRLAHEAAMHRLGGHVLGFSDVKNTRAGDFYQESIKDTVHARILW